MSYSTASLGVRGTLRNRVGGGSLVEEKKQVNTWHLEEEGI